MTAPAAEMPDTITTIIANLAANLAAPVSSKVPNPRPSSFVTVQRTGGPRATRVSDLPQVTLDCWAVDDLAAEALANECRRLLRAMADGSNRDGVIVYRVDEFAGPAYLPDPESRQDRYRFTVSVHSRAVSSSS